MMLDAAETVLQAASRKIVGKRVKQLRRLGIVPANVYGRGRESRAIQTPLTEVQRVFTTVDRNAVVPISIDGLPETIPTVLREVQRHPVNHQILHLDFYEVDLTRRIHSDARLVLIGSSEAESRGGTVVQSLERVALEALPTEMPSVIEVEISTLDDFGQSMLVRDLELPEGVIALTDEAVAVATVLAPRVSEEDEDTEAEEAVEGIEEEEEGEAAAE